MQCLWRNRYRLSWWEMLMVKLSGMLWTKPSLQELRHQLQLMNLLSPYFAVFSKDDLLIKELSSFWHGRIHPKCLWLKWTLNILSSQGCHEVKHFTQDVSASIFDLDNVSLSFRSPCHKMDCPLALMLQLSQQMWLLPFLIYFLEIPQFLLHWKPQLPVGWLRFSSKYNE